MDVDDRPALFAGCLDQHSARFQKRRWLSSLTVKREGNLPITVANIVLEMKGNQRFGHRILQKRMVFILSLKR